VVYAAAVETVVVAAEWAARVVVALATAVV
jgi:hypothetical protein